MRRNRPISTTPTALTSCDFPSKLGAEHVICIPLCSATPHRGLEVVVRSNFPCLRRRSGHAVGRKPRETSASRGSENSPYRFEEISRCSRALTPLKRRNGSFIVIDEAANSLENTPFEPILCSRLSPAPSLISVHINKRRRPSRNQRSPLALRSIRVHHVSNSPVPR